VGKPHVSKSLDSGFRRNDVLHFGNPLRHFGGMTCCTSEIRCVIPAEAGIQNAVPALIEKLQSNPATQYADKPHTYGLEGESPLRH